MEVSSVKGFATHYSLLTLNLVPTMIISEFIAKFGKHFPIEIVEGTAYSFDKDPNYAEWHPKDFRKRFNFKTSKWVALRDPVIEDVTVETTIERAGLFIRFRPPAENWLYFPLNLSLVQAIPETTVPEEAVDTARFYACID